MDDRNSVFNSCSPNRFFCRRRLPTVIHFGVLFPYNIVCVFRISSFDGNSVTRQLFSARIGYPDKRIDKLAAFIYRYFQIFGKVSAVYIFKIPFVTVCKSIVTCVIFSENRSAEMVCIIKFIIPIRKIAGFCAAVNAVVCISNKIERRQNNVVKIPR